MSLFIHPENQQLLWDIMNKVQVVVEFFKPYPPSQKEQWFKSVIQLFYEKYKNHKLVVNDLHKLNQEVVTYIIDTIKQRIIASSGIDNNRSQNKAELYNQQYQTRQTEYKSMYEKPAPPNIDFRSTVEDTAISNMDELMRLHKEQRDADLQLSSFTPPSETRSISQPSHGYQSMPSSSLKIEQTSVNIMAEIIETEESKPKKSVSWGANDSKIIEYEEQLKRQSDEIIYLKSVVTSLSSTIETLCKEMIHVRNTVDISAGRQLIFDQIDGNERG